MNKIKSARAASAGFLALTLKQIATFVITLLAARYLVPAEYGVYTLAIVFITCIQTLTFTGYFHYVVTSKSDQEAEFLSTLFWLILGLGVIASGLLVLVAPYLARVFDAPDMHPVLMLLALIQPVAAVGAWSSAVLLRQKRMSTHFGIMIAQNLLALIAGVFILISWQSVYALVAFRYFRVISGFILYAVFMTTRPQLTFVRSIASSASRYASGLYGSRFMDFMSNYGADLLLGLLFSTAEAGLYRFGNRLATAAIDVVAQPMRSFALSQFGHANREDLAFGPVLNRFSGAILLLNGLVMVCIFVFAADVVATFFNPAYAAGVVVTYALALRATVNMGTIFVEPVLAARGLTGKVMIYHSFWTSVQICVVLLAAQFGLSAVAWSQVGVAVLASLHGMLLIRSSGTTPIGPAFWSALRATAMVAIFGAMAWILWSLMSDRLGHNTTSVILGMGAVVVLGLTWIVTATRLKVLDMKVFSG